MNDRHPGKGGKGRSSPCGGVQEWQRHSATEAVGDLAEEAVAGGADGAKGAHSQEGELHARWEGLSPRAVDAVLLSAGAADSSNVAGYEYCTAVGGWYSIGVVIEVRRATRV